MPFHECTLYPISTEAVEAARHLSALLEKLARVIRDCPSCQGMYCPELIEMNARIVAAIDDVNRCWGMPE